MDLALALWQINPAAEYRLNDDKTTILEWRGPGPEPTADELAAAWEVVQIVQAGAPPSLNEQLANALASLPQDTAVTGAQLAQVIALLRGQQS
jgi:hypothetical protein